VDGLMTFCHDARKGRYMGSHWPNHVAPPLHSTSFFTWTGAAQATSYGLNTTQYDPYPKIEEALDAATRFHDAATSHQPVANTNETGEAQWGFGASSKWVETRQRHRKAADPCEPDCLYHLAVSYALSQPSPVLVACELD